MSPRKIFLVVVNYRSLINSKCRLVCICIQKFGEKIKINSRSVQQNRGFYGTEVPQLPQNFAVGLSDFPQLSQKLLSDSLVFAGL